MVPDNVFPLMPRPRDPEPEPEQQPVPDRLALAYAFVESKDLTGMTWHDLAKATGWHHGQASSALTTLHKRGRIKRLSLTRDRCSVYVAPQHVDDRPLYEPRRSVTAQMLADAIELLRGTDHCMLHPYPQPDDCTECRTIDLVQRYDRRSGG